MKRKKINLTVLKTSIFWLVIFYIAVSLYLILVVEPRNTQELKDKLQTATERYDTCLHNFEAIEPQLEGDTIHLQIKE